MCVRLPTPNRQSIRFSPFARPVFPTPYTYFPHRSGSRPSSFMRVYSEFAAGYQERGVIPQAIPLLQLSNYLPPHAGPLPLPRVERRPPRYSYCHCITASTPHYFPLSAQWPCFAGFPKQMSLDSKPEKWGQLPVFTGRDAGPPHSDEPRKDLR